MNPSTCSRRHLLAAVGASLTAGCFEVGAEEDEAEGVRLGTIMAMNMRDDPEEVQIQLHRNEEVVYEETVELEGGETDLIHPTWSTQPAAYRLLYATEEGIGEYVVPEEAETVDDTICTHFRLVFNQYFFDVEHFEDEETAQLRC